MQRGAAQFFVILVVIILLGIGGVFYYLSNQGGKSSLIVPSSIQKAVATDQDYINQKLGFSFKYLKSFSIKEDSEEDFNKRGGGDFRKNFKGYVSYEPGKFLGGVVVLEKDNYETSPLTVWVFDNPDDLSIDAWYKNYWYYPFVWGDFTHTGKVDLAPKNESTISGQVAKSGVIDYQPGKPKFVYLRSKEPVHLSKDKKIYLFRIIGDGDKILSTFKFTN